MHVVKWDDRLDAPLWVESNLGFVGPTGLLGSAAVEAARKAIGRPLSTLTYYLPLTRSDLEAVSKPTDESLAPGVAVSVLDFADALSRHPELPDVVPLIKEGRPSDWAAGLVGVTLHSQELSSVIVCNPASLMEGCVVIRAGWIGYPTLRDSSAAILMWNRTKSELARRGYSRIEASISRDNKTVTKIAREWGGLLTAHEAVVEAGLESYIHLSDRGSLRYYDPLGAGYHAPDVIYVLRWRSDPDNSRVDSVVVEQGEPMAKKGALSEDGALKELMSMFAEQIRMYLGVLIGIRPGEISLEELEQVASAGTEIVSIEVAMKRDRTATLGNSLQTAPRSSSSGKLISRKLARSSVASGLAKVLMGYQAGELSVVVV